jgi:hypothetical protein
MRRVVTWTLSLMLIAAFMIIISAIVLTNRAVAAAQGRPSFLCLEEREAVRLAAGTLPMSRRDMIVASSANFALGPQTGIWWHVREATIAATYRAFWTEQSRSVVFAGVVARMRRCPAHERP